MNRNMQGKRLTTMLAAGLLTMAAASSAYAYPASSEILAKWNTKGMTGTEASLAGTGYCAIYDVQLTRGSGLTGNAGGNSMNTKGWDGTDAGDYIEFSFKKAAGYIVTLDDIWIGTKSSSTGPGTMGFYSSLDNFANFSQFASVSLNGDFRNDSIYINYLGEDVVFDCPDEEFAIRLYEIGNTQADGSGDTASTGTFRVTDYEGFNVGSDAYDIVITGQCVPCPVPAAAWLLGSGLLGLVGLKRKRQ
jgi:hypothetical protein